MPTPACTGCHTLASAFSIFVWLRTVLSGAASTRVTPPMPWRRSSVPYRELRIVWRLVCLRSTGPRRNRVVPGHLPFASDGCPAFPAPRVATCLSRPVVLMLYPLSSSSRTGSRPQRASRPFGSLPCSKVVCEHGANDTAGRADTGWEVGRVCRLACEHMRSYVCFITHFAAISNGVLCNLPRALARG